MPPAALYGLRCSAVRLVHSHHPYSTLSVTRASVSDMRALETSRVLVGGRYATIHTYTKKRHIPCLSRLRLVVSSLISDHDFRHFIATATMDTCPAERQRASSTH
eukprot:4763438-Prymnesium_polylepis.1